LPARRVFWVVRAISFLFLFSGSYITLRPLGLPDETRPRLDPQVATLGRGDGAELLVRFGAPACELQGRSSGSPVANPRAPNEVPIFCFCFPAAPASSPCFPLSQGARGRSKMRRVPAPGALQSPPPLRSGRSRFLKFGSDPGDADPGTPSMSSRGLSDVF